MEDPTDFEYMKTLTVAINQFKKEIDHIDTLSPLTALVMLGVEPVPELEGCMRCCLAEILRSLQECLIDVENEFNEL